MQETELPQALKVSQAKYNFNYQDIGRWLPFSTDATSIEDFLSNLALYPNAVPLSGRELELYQALVREILRAEQKDVVGEKSTLVLNDEVLKISRSDHESLLIVLDGVLPSGLVQIYSKSENGPKVASAICFSGDAKRQRDKQKVAEISIDFGLAQKQKVVLEEDDLTLIPVNAEEKVSLKIKCFDEFRVGKKKDLKLETTGGTVGIIFDTRGRPFKFPEYSDEGRKRLFKWRKALGIF